MIAEELIKKMLYKEAETKHEYYKRVSAQNFLFNENEKQLTETPKKQEPKQEIKQEPSPVYYPPVNYVPKQTNKKRRLLKNRPTRRLGSIQERLQRAANKLDEEGHKRIANKIDQLLTKIIEISNAGKTSNL